MIDLHSHILPGIDDGAQNLDDSLNLARKAVEQGITHLLCTPHHHNGKYINHKTDVMSDVNTLQSELDTRGIPLTIFASQEVRINGDLLQQIEDDDILFCDASNRYLLVEFPTAEAPSYAIRMMEELRARGIIPIIAHPERNGTFRKDPNKLIEFLDIGCLAQLTAPSIIGIFGKDIKKTAKVMIENGLVQMVASDAHHVDKRTFYLKEAYEEITKHHGEETTDYFMAVAKGIINGEDIDVRPYYEKKKKRFFGLR